MKYISIQKLLVSLMAAQSLLAIPTYQRTTLPVPSSMNLDEARMVREILQLQVYPDDKNPFLYYFLPPMHPRQYVHGAAGLSALPIEVEDFAKAKANINQKLQAREKHALEYTEKKLSQLREDIENINKRKIHYEQEFEASKNNLRAAQKKLMEAEESGDQALIARWKDYLELEREFFEESKEDVEQITKKLLKAEEELDRAQAEVNQGKNLLPPGIGRTYFQLALEAIAGIGGDAGIDASEDPIKIVSYMRGQLAKVSNRYAGYMSLNVYAGFTKSQLDALRAFKAKYMPHLTIALLPVEKLTFFSLTELHDDEYGNSHDMKFYRNIRGSGDYLGAALVLDTTIAGAEGISRHLQPMVLPIGVKATYKHQGEPTEADLVCDFSHGFEVNGQADVRDGRVIFDNDITNTISSHDKSSGACNIINVKGDQTTAEYKALEELQIKFDEIHLRRTILTPMERERYLNGVLKDIAANRRLEEPKYTRIIKMHDNDGWYHQITEGLTRDSDFHWYTNKQNVSHISSVQFTKKLRVNGLALIERDMPTNLCLVFNNKRKAYDRCTSIEELEMVSMQKSINTAEASPECQGVIHPEECGKKRDEAGSTERRPDFILEEDDILVSTIE